MEITGRKTFYFDHDLENIDTETDRLIKLEEERQQKKIILIASESISPKPVRDALGSVFTNIYAEGYPSTRMGLDDLEHLLDHKHQLSYIRRYSDNKYYKGTEFVDFVESLAQKRAALLFANEKVPAEKIHVNVQPLSGAPGNNAVFTAFLRPGDTVLSMALNCGGHLSHGSDANRSGMNYNVIPYGVEPGETKLNYGKIRKLAVENRPRLIIAGYSAYPWDIDWKALREIADEVGPDCLLLADVSHIAALIVGGVLNNPIEYADVIMTTTHKALAGPRGAILLTTDPEKAELLDRAVFPGEQGGPHVNNIAAQAVCFLIAGSGEFQEYTRKVAENAKYFSEVCKELGLKLAYGGTETHLFLIDLKCLGKKNGYYVTGEIATRILDQCGITVNKNTITGDENATHPTGIRIGTPWITQRGFSKDNIRRLAAIIHEVLVNIQPFHYVGQIDDVGRGKIDLDVFLKARNDVAELLEDVHNKPVPCDSGYPYYLIPGRKEEITPLHEVHVKAGAELSDHHGWTTPSDYGNDPSLGTGTVLIDTGFNKLLRLRGDQERLRPFLEQVFTGDMLMEPGESRRTFMLNAKGNVMDDVVVARLPDPRDGSATYIVETTAGNGVKVREWLRGLADGYILFDEKDIYAKVEGPVVVEDLGSDMDDGIKKTGIALMGPDAMKMIGSFVSEAVRIEAGAIVTAEIDGCEVLINPERMGETDIVNLYVHPGKAALLWNHLLVNSGAELRPGGYSSLDMARKGAGLPDYMNEVSGSEMYDVHGDRFKLTKPYYVGGRKIVAHAALDTDKKEWEWKPPEEELKRTALYEEHVKLGGRIVPFAGWEMPVLYEGIAEEHRIIRTTAGLFDVSHMGVLEFSGKYAVDFIDMITSNYTRWIIPGETQYAYILGPDGNVLDDIFVYRRSVDNFMMVVNASNANKIWDWVNAVNTNNYILDRDNPAVEVPPGVLIRDLKDPSCGKDRRIDIALQGPESLNILLELADDDFRTELKRLERTKFIVGSLNGIDVIVARTGYTGEKIGFELFIHPDNAVALWRLLLERGERFGIKPTGLGARDSTRTEAGFPLYGHEIEGSLNVYPMENGYAQFLKLHKPFYIGRSKVLGYAEGVKMEIVRFRLNRSSARMLHTGDPVAGRRGDCIGYVTSSVLVENHQIGLAYLRKRYNRVGARINIFPLPHRGKAPRETSRDAWKTGDKTIIPEEGTIIPRFPQENEMLDRVLTGDESR